LTPCPPTPLRGKGRRERTILQRFRGSVEALVSELVSDECQEVRFIRCIRPNETLTEGQVDYDLVKRQLSSAGITDVLRITANSLPIR
jgi:myosin heavy subunit